MNASNPNVPDLFGGKDMNDYLAELNERQAEAVLHADGPLLIIAGAGSGKTRVLTYRIAQLLATQKSLGIPDTRPDVYQQGCP